MKFLGIDPGVERVGFGVIDIEGGAHRLVEYGVITTPSGTPLPERLVMIERDVNSVLRRHPDLACVGIEELFFAKNAKTAFMVGQARGVILFTVSRGGYTIQEVKPVEVKAAVAGNGAATKKEMQRMVQLTFGLQQPPQPDDAADAVAIALTAAAQFRLQSSQASSRNTSN